MGLKKEGNEDDDKEMRGTRTQCNGNDEGKSGNSSWIFEVGPALDQITGTLKISGCVFICNSGLVCHVK